MAPSASSSLPVPNSRPAAPAISPARPAAIFAPGSRSRCLATILLLAAGIIGLLLLINRQYFFHTYIYATGDQAANSLEVLRCKKFEVYLGNYSRWGFHHPGPFYLYYLAAAETVFYNLLHLTPTPFGAQVLGALCLGVGFFAVGVGIASRWVRSPFFVPLALLLAALHYTAVHLEMCLFDTWTAYVSPMPYFCLLVAAASVAAGQGEDLPWLLFAGCFLIHLHVANPLFVLPLFGLAYAGLCWACRRGKAPAPPDAEPGDAATTDVSRWPWRRYPRAHVLGAALAVLFVLPIVFDLCHGTHSNFALILHHLRTHEGDHYPFLEATYYLLCFGIYKPAIFGNVQILGGVNPAMISHLVLHHYMVFVWLVALLSPLLVFALRAGLKPLAGPANEAVAEPWDGRRWRFVGWLVACFALCVPLALYWAHIQDGDMLFYNAWYVYSLYGVLTIVAAASLSDALERIVRRFRWPRLLTATVALLCLAAAEAHLGWPSLPPRNFASLGNYDFARAANKTVLDALAAHPEAPRTKFLVIPDNVALLASAGVAISLVRAGYDFRVLPIPWNIMFGQEYMLPDSWLTAGASAGAPPMDPWRMIRPELIPGVPPSHPLADHFALQTGYSEIDPTQESVIIFGGPEHNCESYALVGFAQPDPDALARWTIDHFARLDFDAHPVPSDAAVEIDFDFLPPLINRDTHPSQRMQVRYNSTDLGTLTATEGTPPESFRVQVPAAVWNAQPIGILELRFPDAISPAELLDDPHGDPRLLGFAARKIMFRVVKPTGEIQATP